MTDERDRADDTRAAVRLWLHALAIRRQPPAGLRRILLAGLGGAVVIAVLALTTDLTGPPLLLGAVVVVVVVVGILFHRLTASVPLPTRRTTEPRVAGRTPGGRGRGP